MKIPAQASTSRDLSPVFEQRFRAYKDAMLPHERDEITDGKFKDDLDEKPNTHYVTAHNFLGSARIIDGVPGFGCRFYGIPFDPTAVEINRIVIDPSVDDTGKRVEIITALFDQIDTRWKGRKQYVTATETMGKLYGLLFGFSLVEGTEEAIIYPGKVPVRLYVRN